jgi:hypothetical protein
MHFTKNVILTVICFGTVWAQNPSPVSHWSFDNDSNGFAFDINSNELDKINGYAAYKKGVHGKALKFDEMSTQIVKDISNIPDLSGGKFTFEAWIAQQAYPLNWCPIVEQKDLNDGFFFGVDADGRFGLHVSVNGMWYRCNTRSAYPGYETFHTWDSDRRKWMLHDREKSPPEPLQGQADPVLPLLKWTHIVGIFDQTKGITLYLNGKKEAELQVECIFKQANSPIHIGRSEEKYYPAHTERFYGTQPLNYSFDGLMDELKIYNRALSDDEVKTAFNSLGPDTNQPLQFRKIPTGPKGPGKFGAYYTHLKYDEDFDRYYRMKKYSDVVVMFDEYPFKLVSWHGINYYPIWYSENDIGISHEAVETWGNLGTHEAMMDKQTRYASIRIIENTDARVVLHYRHAMNNMAYELIHEDSISGWHDWCDEILSIYPDGVAARNLIHWCSYLGLTDEKGPIYVEDFLEVTDDQGNLIVDNPTDDKLEKEEEDQESYPIVGADSQSAPIVPVHVSQPHSYEQDNFIVPIGMTPSDILHKEGGIHANMQGEESSYTWEFSGRPRGKRIINSNIVVYNIKAESKPYMIVPPEAARHFFEGNGKPWPNCYYWWDHWPVAQLKSDGMQIHFVNGRPSSSCIGSASFKLDTTVFKYENNSISVYSLLGMAMNTRAGDLVPLARSWIHAPYLKISSDNFESEGYLREERCYSISSKDKEADLEFSIYASESTPLVNLALSINNWGNANANLRLNGNDIAEGKNFRYGHRENLDGTIDLLIFIKHQSFEQTEVELIRLKE